MSAWTQILFRLRGAACTAEAEDGQPCGLLVHTNVGLYMFDRENSRVDFMPACSPPHFAQIARKVHAALCSAASFIPPPEPEPPAEEETDA